MWCGMMMRPCRYECMYRKLPNSTTLGMAIFIYPDPNPYQTPVYIYISLPKPLPKPYRTSTVLYVKSEYERYMYVRVRVQKSCTRTVPYGTLQRTARARGRAYEYGANISRPKPLPKPPKINIYMNSKVGVCSLRYRHPSIRNLVLAGYPAPLVTLAGYPCYSSGVPPIQ